MLRKATVRAIVIFLIIMTSAYLVSSRNFAIISGTVKSEDGKPIKGAKVILIFSEDGSQHELETDEKGKWRKANIFPGTWKIGFMAEGYKPQNITVQISAIKENKPIDIRLARNPESPFSRGDALYQQQKYPEALQEYQEVLAKSPELYEAEEKIGLCHYRLDNLEKAIEAFKLVLKKNPQSQDTLINLSAIYFQKGNLEEGMKYFNQLDEKNLRDPSVFYNIGLLFFKSNQIDMAIGYFSKSLELDPGYVDGHYQLALANLNKGNMEEAKKNLQKVVELAPQSEKAGLARKMLESIKE